MSQRGGSVVTYVKYGEKVYSPVIEKGEADIIVSFEQLEALRWIPYLKKGGKIVASSQRIDPMPVIMGSAEYPTDIEGKIKDAGIEAMFLNADELAISVGSSKAANVVLLGALSTVSDFSPELWEQAVVKCVPEKFKDLNIKAFQAGRNAVSK
jgi:indolepyruvate ferredoxin oxidoreductase beta subunit